MITKTYILLYLTTTYYNDNELYIVEGFRQSGRAGKKTIFFSVCALLFLLRRTVIKVRTIRRPIFQINNIKENAKSVARNRRLIIPRTMTCMHKAAQLNSK